MRKLLVLLLSFFTANAYSAPDPKAAYEESLKGKAVLIDVREENEIKEGMIKGARWFPMSRLKNDPEWMNDFRKMTADKKIYLYCRSGNRSGQVMKILSDEGLASENLGGMLTLKDQLPVEK